MALQFWPGETVVGHHIFAGGRLRFIPEDDILRLPPRLDFEFTRTFNDVALHQISPPSQIIRSTIPQEPHVPIKPFELLQSSNQFLRNEYPQIDCPKSLLLENLLEDQDFYEHTTPLQSSLLTGMSIDEHHAMILAVGGSLGNELYCSLLGNDRSKLPRFPRNPKPVATLRTPVQQLANGPSLNLAGQAVFLARTYDSTSLFTYSPPDAADFSTEDPTRDQSSYYPSFGFESSFVLDTSDTGHEVHVDTCVGHTINDTLHQFIVLSSKGQLWKVSGIGGNNISIKQFGHMDSRDPGDITWARCGIYPMNDCLVVGLRKSVGIVDHRLAGNCSELYVANDGHQITDIQRCINNRSPHLRLINTTSSIMWIDDRKPQIPMLMAKHFRAPDPTINVSFCAEPEWSPHPSFSISTAAERFDKVILWSRTNDIASLHQFQSYDAIPPGLLGHGVQVPMTSCKPPNYRTGLLFFRHKVLDDDPRRISVVEMKRDGSVWHQQVKLFDPAENPPPANAMVVEQVPQPSSEIPGAKGDSSDNSDSDEGADVVSSLPELELELEAICDDFTHTCLDFLDKLPSIELFDEETLSPSCTFLHPLKSPKLLRSSDSPTFPILAEHAGISNGLLSPISFGNDHTVDLTPVLKSLLPRCADIILDDRTNSIGDMFANTIEERVHHILTNVIQITIKAEVPIQATSDDEASSQDEPRNQDESQSRATVNKQPRKSIAVDWLIDEWKIGEPTGEHRWKDVGNTNSDEVTADQYAYNADCRPLSCYSPGPSQSRSRFSSVEPSQDIRGSRESTGDVSKGYESAGPSRYQSRASSPKSNQHRSASVHLFDPTSASTDIRFGSSLNPYQSQQHPNDILVTSNSQPNPQRENMLSSSATALGFSFNDPQTVSQVVPGPHAARNPAINLNINNSKKKRRVGGF